MLTRNILRCSQIGPNRLASRYTAFVRFQSTEQPPNHHHHHEHSGGPDWSSYPVRGPTDPSTADGALRLEYILLQATSNPAVESRVMHFTDMLFSRITLYRNSLNLKDGYWRLLGEANAMKVAKWVILWKILTDRDFLDEWTEFMEFLEEYGFESTNQDITLVGNFVQSWLKQED